MSMYDACSSCGERCQGHCWTCHPYPLQDLCGSHLLTCAKLDHNVEIKPFGKDDPIDPELLGLVAGKQAAVITEKKKHWRYDYPGECTSWWTWLVCGWSTGWRFFGVQYDRREAG